MSPEITQIILLIGYITIASSSSILVLKICFYIEDKLKDKSNPSLVDPELEQQYQESLVDKPKNTGVVKIKVVEEFAEFKPHFVDIGKEANYVPSVLLQKTIKAGSKPRKNYKSKK